MAFRASRVSGNERFRVFDASISSWGVRDTLTGEVVQADFTDTYSAQSKADELNENPPAEDD